MEGKRRTAISILAAMVLVLVFSLASVYAEEAARVDIKTPSEVQRGDHFEASIIYSGSSMGVISSVLEYDPEILSHISGGEKAKGGEITLDNDVGGADSFTFKVKFKAKKEGQTALSVTSKSVWDTEDISLGSPIASKTLTVVKAASNEGSVANIRDRFESDKELFTFYMICIGINSVLLLTAIGINNRKKYS